jgi:hypothetical protein
MPNLMSVSSVTRGAYSQSQYMKITRQECKRLLQLVRAALRSSEVGVAGEE